MGCVCFSQYFEGLLPTNPQLGAALLKDVILAVAIAQLAAAGGVFIFVDVHALTYGGKFSWSDEYAYERLSSLVDALTGSVHSGFCVVTVSRGAVRVYHLADRLSSRWSSTLCTMLLPAYIAFPVLLSCMPIIRCP